MSPLRARMIEDMTLAGLAVGTQKIYTQAVYGLAKHYRRSPDQLGEEEVRAYLLGLRQRGVARGTFQTSQYGLRFLYHHTLGTPASADTEALGKGFSRIAEYLLISSAHGGHAAAFVYYGDGTAEAVYLRTRNAWRKALGTEAQVRAVDSPGNGAAWDGERLLVVASQGGAAKHPAWYLNLTADPDEEVQVGADRFEATARPATPDEKPALWRVMTSIWQAYDDYQARTDRDIPVVILDPA